MPTDSVSSPEKSPVQENFDNVENQALTRQEQEKQEAGELLDTLRDRPWSTEAEREEKADQVKEIISTGLKEQPVTEDHNEAGMPLKAEYKTEAQKRKAIEDLMNSSASGNDQTEILKGLME